MLTQALKGENGEITEKSLYEVILGLPLTIK